MSGNGREALPDVREWSEGYPGSPRVVRRSSRRSGSGRASHPDVMSWSVGPPDVREWS